MIFLIADYLKENYFSRCLKCQNPNPRKRLPKVLQRRKSRYEEFTKLETVRLPSGETETTWGQAERKREEREIFQTKDKGKGWTSQDARQGCHLYHHEYDHKLLCFSTNWAPPPHPLTRRRRALTRRETPLDLGKRRLRRIPWQVGGGWEAVNTRTIFRGKTTGRDSPQGPCSGGH